MKGEYDEKRKLMGYPVAEGHIAHEIAGAADGCWKRCPFGRNVIHYNNREDAEIPASRRRIDFVLRRKTDVRLHALDRVG